jgi:FkbM family methyltransferase
MFMLGYFRNKLKKYKAKRIFNEYGYKVVDFQLSSEGKIKYAQWLNPLEKEKEITQSQVNFFKKFVKAGDTAIDIGAHTGDTPIPMALAAGRNGKVLALEPNPYIFKILEVNATLNKDKANIIPLCFAATATDGEFFYSSSEASFNNGGISESSSHQHGSFSMGHKVKGINLEKYLKTNHLADLKKLTLIKVDTEGYDVQVLKSLDNILSEYKPSIIFECFGGLSKTERESLHDSIARHGYSLFYFKDFEENTEVLPITKADMMNWKHFDVYAVVKSL